jgi:hypothetical protein
MASGWGVEAMPLIVSEKEYNQKITRSSMKEQEVP